MSATDPDGDNVTYLIPTNSQNSQYFKVDNETGQIFTRQGVIIDREVSANESTIRSYHG